MISRLSAEVSRMTDSIVANNNANYSKTQTENKNRVLKGEQMIARNETLNPSEGNQGDPQSIRDFTRVLRAAKPFWEEFLSQPEDHVARGLVFTANRGITADLSFNTHCKRVILMIRLRPNNNLSPSQRQSVKKVQNETQGLSSVAFDEEGRILKIRSQSVLPAAVLAQAVVPQIFEDTVALLEHDNLKDIVDQSVSY